MYELPQETPYEFKTLNFPQFNKNLYYRMTDLCAIYVLYLFFFCYFYSSGEKHIKSETTCSWRILFIAFERYWKELFKRIIIHEIVQNVIVMCYNTHYISSNPRKQVVFQPKDANQMWLGINHSIQSKVYIYMQGISMWEFGGFLNSPWRKVPESENLFLQKINLN